MTTPSDFMNLEHLSSDQVDGLLELLVLGMYADSHLAAAEDATIRGVAAAAGLPTGYDMDKSFDRAVSVTSQHGSEAAAIADHLDELARVFDTTEIKRDVLDALEGLHQSDSAEAESEKKFMQLAKEQFGM
ncbi:MAG: putative tellurite resistance protein B-like protein [Limisphaerales bacterium]|jgi:uncharacterized tellurite resistance protein B-like protein